MLLLATGVAAAAVKTARLSTLASDAPEPAAGGSFVVVVVVGAAAGLAVEEENPGRGWAASAETWPTAPGASTVTAGATDCACKLEEGESGGDAARLPPPSPLVVMAAAAAAKDFFGDACCGDTCAPL